MPCPEIELTSIDGEKIDLTDLIGNVIILKFSRFYRTELPNLLYLEHLAGKLKNSGVSLVFINSLGKHYRNEIEKICTFPSPIVEDLGNAGGLFNAAPEDTIIVDRNFTIKAKYPFFDKRVIYSDVKRWTEYDENGDVETNNSDSIDKIDGLFYFDVIEKKKLLLLIRIRIKKY